MSTGSNLGTDEQFLCPICLDVFADPVSTPCGHNFCEKCISQLWDGNATYSCPVCKESFGLKPQLRVNTLIRHLVSEFEHESQQKASSSSEQQVDGSREVPCDVCSEPKLRALKSCLVCLASFCQTHLEPHLTVSSLRRHQLKEPVENLEDIMCKHHDKPLELFCRTDQACVCMLCSVLDHKSHEFVPLRQEYEVKKADLEQTEEDLQKMIRKRRLRLEELKESVKISNDAADRKKAEAVAVFTALKRSVVRDKKKLERKIQEKQDALAEQAEGFSRALEQEISDLKKRSSEVEQLIRSEDHLHLLQSFSSLKAAPANEDWPEVQLPSYEGILETAVVNLKDTLIHRMENLIRAQLERVQQHAVDVALDPDTAHPGLILSDDGKQVYQDDDSEDLPDNPEIFSSCYNVLGNQSFSSGRFYFKVQVEGKTCWDVGVVRGSIRRKGGITAAPQKGFWIVCLRNANQYQAFDASLVPLSLRSVPEYVGVFVDYEEGLVSFYDAGTAAHIYAFTGCCFTDKLFPLFSPGPNDGGQNSAPLIICPVNQNDLSP